MLYSLLIKNCVLDANGKSLGRARKIIVDFATGKILELVIGSFLNFNRKSIPIELIKTEKEGLLYLKSSQYIRDKNTETEKGDIKNFKVFTESGDFLGKVKDFNINLDLWRVSEIIAEKVPTGKKSAISEQQIISIEKNKIIVKDAFIEEAMPSAA